MAKREGEAITVGARRASAGTSEARRHAAGGRAHGGGRTRAPGPRRSVSTVSSSPSATATPSWRWPWPRPPPRRVDLGTAAALAFPRSPMEVAYTAWDLQGLSGGRLQLGLATQVRAHIERRYSAVWSDPPARMREFVLALRAIWTAWRDGTPARLRGATSTGTRSCRPPSGPPTTATPFPRC